MEQLNGQDKGNLEAEKWEVWKHRNGKFGSIEMGSLDTETHTEEGSKTIFSTAFDL